MLMDQTEIKSVVSAFFVRLLRPAVRILLRHGVSFREMAELCRGVCVAEATSHFGDGGRPASVSTVALQTGMTRRDVRKVRLLQDSEEQQTIGRMNMAGRVLSGWFLDEDFLAPDGKPLPLSESGAFPSFTDLAKRYAADVPASATLKELKRSGAIVENEDGRLVAISRDYMPGIVDPAAPEALTRSGSVLEDIGNTVEHNLIRGPDGTPRFERRATNINISDACVDDFREFINREGQAFLERVDAWLSEHEVDSNEERGGEPLRLGLGMYWIQDTAR